jgi:hypothetical protein
MMQYHQDLMNEEMINTVVDTSEIQKMKALLQ